MGSESLHSAWNSRSRSLIALSLSLSLALLQGPHMSSTVGNCCGASRVFVLFLSPSAPSTIHTTAGPPTSTCTQFATGGFAAVTGVLPSFDHFFQNLRLSLPPTLEDLGDGFVRDLIWEACDSISLAACLEHRASILLLLLLVWCRLSSRDSECPSRFVPLGFHERVS